MTEDAQSRQLARLHKGEKPPAARDALAMAKSQAYQAAADSPSTLRAYAADLLNFKAWCEANGFQAVPADPETVGAYLAAAGLGYALPTLRRRVAAIARAHRMANHPLDTKHPAIRETLRGIGRTHGEPARKSAALTTAEMKRIVEVCGDDLAGLRDRALLLMGFAGALRRSELVGMDIEHMRPTSSGFRLTIPRSKTDAAGEGAEIGITEAANADTCPVRSLHAWLMAAAINDGAVFRRVTKDGTVGGNRLTPEAVRQILKRRAAAAGVKGTLMEPVTPHGMRAGFVTTAYKNGVPDEEIMGHTRHRSLTTMRGYVRRAKLGTSSPSGKLGL